MPDQKKISKKTAADLRLEKKNKSSTPTNKGGEPKNFSRRLNKLNSKT